ncbi:MAG: hypothetical protein FJ279_19840 [Planctomycetes bacterium]|nr:hypothetical protein [Planctomycetota bacterium]MBM4079886.1 hypothetical protein [Planctomycetota bacterium]MBM4085088.1 hypothetical protein [Planctomycetota bacterium]
MVLLGVFLAALVALRTEASKIQCLPLAKVDALSRLVVVGYVSQILARDRESDLVSVRLVFSLRGQTEAKEFQLRLRNKGVMDFDPELRVGNQCVFFLEGIQDGQAKLAYWGSIAVIPNQNFTTESENEAPGKSLQPRR